MSPHPVRRFMAQLADGPFTFPGSHPVFFVTADGGCLSFASAWAERAEIYRALANGDRRGGWYVEASDINWESEDLYCGHSGSRIEAAYVDDDDHLEDLPEPVSEDYFVWRKRVTP